jgi:hypothetical protein
MPIGLTCYEEDNKCDLFALLAEHQRAGLDGKEPVMNQRS